MDKSWLSSDRLSTTYEEGVKAFLEFGQSNAKLDVIRCPCVICLGQGHLSEHWPDSGVDDDEKKALLAQVASLNSSYPGGLASYIKTAKELLADSKAGRNPFDGFMPSEYLSLVMTSTHKGIAIVIMGVSGAGKSLSAHLEALGFDVSLVATEWFLCLFSKSLPSDMKEEELLLTHHIGDAIKIIQNTTHHLFDPDDLLTVAFDKISFMTTNISKQRKKQETVVMAELDQRLRRLNTSKLSVAS